MQNEGHNPRTNKMKGERQRKDAALECEGGDR